MNVHRLKRCVLAVLVATIGSASGHEGRAASPAIDDRLIRVLEETGPAPVISPALWVDADRFHRSVVPGTCAEAGELELSRLTLTAELEEAFAFIPDACIWIDVGVDQTASSVRVERGVIDALVATYGRVALYHLHLEEKDAAAGYFPAYSDLLAVILINSPYREDGRVEIIHRAVTPAGIFEYAFEPSEAGERVIRAIFDTGLAPFAGENLLLSYAGPEREGEYYDAIRSCLALVEGGARLSRCFPMKAGDFVLTHRQQLEPLEMTLIPLGR